MSFLDVEFQISEEVTRTVGYQLQFLPAKDLMAVKSFNDKTTVMPTPAAKSETIWVSKQIIIVMNYKPLTKARIKKSVEM